LSDGVIHETSKVMVEEGIRDFISSNRGLKGAEQVPDAFHAMMLKREVMTRSRWTGRSTSFKEK
jgi:hypothetical protein